MVRLKICPSLCYIFYNQPKYGSFSLIVFGIDKVFYVHLIEIFRKEIFRQDLNKSIRILCQIHKLRTTILWNYFVFTHHLQYFSCCNEDFLH